jgi:hypothetical protein
MVRGKRLFIGVFLGVAVSIGGYCVGQSRSVGPVEIFQGITFRSEVLPSSDEGRGRLYLAVADLSAPGIELFVTPLDDAALAKGWHYRLRRISDVMTTERLSVAINASMFGSHSPLWFRMPGDLANSAYGTIVADHVVGEIQHHSDVLWFDERLRPQVLQWDPQLRAKDLAAAKWAVGGSFVMRNGQLSDGLASTRDSRTMVGVDDQRRLFLAVGEDISPRLMAQKLAEKGAKHALMLDGGTSSMMAIGRNAQGVPPGVVWGGWRPVATYFGIRAPIAGGVNSK